VDDGGDAVATVTGVALDIEERLVIAVCPVGLVLDEVPWLEGEEDADVLRFDIAADVVDVETIVGSTAVLLIMLFDVTVSSVVLVVHMRTP
jgi:hypothetical protein